MRVGILTMQRVHNYGSFLQAYALRRMLEELGCVVQFVDIERSNAPEEKMSLTEKRSHLDRYILKRVTNKVKNRALAELFLKEQKEILQLSEERVTAEGCDAALIGSDEIFDCGANSPWRITPERFGGGLPVKTTVSYAASCGHTDWKDIRPADAALIRRALAEMKGVSVRDENTLSIVKRLGVNDPQIHLDPVLVYDYAKEMKQAEDFRNEKPYMLVYSYRNRIESPQEIDAIRTYAKKRQLRTVAVGGSLPWCDEFRLMRPFDVLNCFKHAACVVTDTFHGTVMGAKFARPMAVLIRESNRQKLGDLVSRLEIGRQTVCSADDIGHILDQETNYSRCGTIIRTETARSAEWLRRYFGETGEK